MRGNFLLPWVLSHPRAKSLTALPTTPPFLLHSASKPTSAMKKADLRREVGFQKLRLVSMVSWPRTNPAPQCLLQGHAQRECYEEEREKERKTRREAELLRTETIAS
jgi:hypothetical protein